MEAHERLEGCPAFVDRLLRNEFENVKCIELLDLI
jgi:hypothetical protein